MKLRLIFKQKDMFSEKKSHLSTLALLCGVMPVWCANHQLPKVERPNILWLSCEDISPTLSFYGDSTAHTPNLDQLARESLVFTRAFAVVGVCAPSRSAIITGMYPASIGTQNMRTAHDVMGWGVRKYDQKTEATDVAGKPVRLYSAVIPDFVKCFTEYLRAAGYYCTNNYKTDYQFAAPVTAWDDNSINATWENCPAEKPFFSVFNHEVTHESRMWMNRHLQQTVSPGSVPLPDYYPEDSIMRQDVARNYSNIELLDKQLGEKIAELKKAGLYDTTIIFFFSDHGGPLPRGKREIYDSGLRVPLLVHFPRGAYAGRVDDLVSYVDLAPTILSLAGIKPPEYMQGQAFLGKYKVATPRKYIFGSGDRFDAFSDRIRIVRDKRFLFVKNFYPNLPAYKDVIYRKQMDMMNELLCLRDAGKLSGPTAYWFRLTKTSEEFYDCNTDPFNLKNLIDDPKYADRIKELRNALDEFINKIHDKASIPEAQMIEQMWPGGIQPKTAQPVVAIQGEPIGISCPTPGASIGYILSDKQMTPELNSGWQLYYQSIKANGAKYLYVVANRIGFSDSEIVTKELK
jgi:arylsulfatase A-like enzyme